MLIDRSRIETRLLCKMKRFLQYDAFGKGIVKIQPPDGVDHRKIGQAFHAGAEQLLKGVDIVSAIQIALMSDDDYYFPTEQRYLIGGMLNGWARVRLNNIIEEYDVIETETQHNVDFGGITVPLRRDALLRRKSDGQLVVLDFKTLSSQVASWHTLMQNSLQTLMYVFGTEKLSGERCAGVQYEGVNKGRYEKGMFQSPYCYGYTNGSEWTASYTNKKGWKKAPVWYDFNPYSWSKVLHGEGTLFELFQVSPPTRPSGQTMMAVVGQIVENELIYKRYLELNDGDKFRFLEFNPSACFKYGSNYPCEYHSLCFGGDVDKMTEVPDGYEERKPHHESQE